MASPNPDRNEIFVGLGAALSSGVFQRRGNMSRWVFDQGSAPLKNPEMGDWELRLQIFHPAGVSGAVVDGHLYRNSDARIVRVESTCKTVAGVVWSIVRVSGFNHVHAESAHQSADDVPESRPWVLPGRDHG